jgi:hypothetical protein
VSCSRKNGRIDLAKTPDLGVELDLEVRTEKVDPDWRDPETCNAEYGLIVDR